MLYRPAESCAFLVFLKRLLLFHGGKSVVHGLIKTGLHLHLSVFCEYQGDHHRGKLFAHLCCKGVGDGAVELATDSNLANAGERLVKNAWLLLTAHWGTSFCSHCWRSSFQISMASSRCSVLSRSRHAGQEGVAQGSPLMRTWT